MFRHPTYYAVPFLLLWLTSLSTAPAGIVNFTGREHEVWTSGTLSVLVAKFVDAKPEDPHEANPVDYIATLEPLATIAGTLDASAHRELNLHFAVGDASAIPIHVMPRKGAIVLVVIAYEFQIVPGATTFMPDRLPLVEIDGLGDKRVHETLDRIRDARAHEDRDINEPPPATEPSNRSGEQKG